jgi:putative flippase GtrA
MGRRTWTPQDGAGEGVRAGAGGRSTAAARAARLLRQWWPLLAANLGALVITTLLNTEANRRFTFAGPHTSTGRTRVHVQGLVVFGLYYLFTSAALLLLHASAANPSRLLELSVLLVSSGRGTAGRFLLLRRWIFKPGKDN